jgi:zinc protease
MVPLFLLIFSAAAAQGAGEVFPYPYEKQTLANGLTVVVVPMPTPELVSYFSIVRTGSRDEVEPGRSGFAHFFEHMMFRGSKKYPGPVRERIVTSLGARANASTTDDFTMFHLTFAKEDLEKVIELEADRFQHLSYDEAAFQTEAGAVYGEYRIGAAQPWFALHEKLQDLAYDVHTYKHTTIGFEADVKAMPKAYQYSLGFYRRYYRPENVVLLVTGDVKPAAAFRLIEKYYGSWPRGYRPPQVVPEPPQTAPRAAEMTFHGRTLPILVLAYKGDAFNPANRDYVAARLLADLAFGSESELYKKLALRQQKVEMLFGDVPMNRDQPLFEIGAMVKNAGDVDAVRDEIDRTLEEFKTKPVALAKLAELKRRNRYAFVMELDTPEKVAEALSRYVAVSGGIEAIERLFAASDQVTPEDIMHAAGKYFVPARRTTIVLKGEDAAAKPNGRKRPAKVAQRQTPSVPLAASPAKSSSSKHESDGAATLSGSNFTSAAAPPVLLPVAGDPTISFRVWFKVGSQDDPPGKEGLAAITARMIGEGSTRVNDYESILDRLFPLAAGYAAQSDTEMTVVSARVHKDNLAAFYPLLAQAMLAPALKQQDLDRIKFQTLSFLKNVLRYSSDEDLGKAVLYNTIFAGTPYGHLGAGTVAGVQGITLDDVKNFYRRHYTRQNVVVGLGGGYRANLVRDLERDLGRLPAAAAATAPLPEPAPIRGRQVTIVEKDCGATAISVGFPIDVLRGSKSWYALAVANAWLGQHRNSASHLYQVIRDRRGLNYGDYSYIERFPGGTRLLIPPTNVCRRRQIFELWIRPVPHAARHFALRAALRELKHLVDHGMTESEFIATRNFLRKYVLHLAPTTTDRLGYALDDRFYGVKGGHLATFRRMMDELTLADVNAAVKRYLQYENLEIVLVTQDAQSLKEALVADAASPIEYPTRKAESILAEDCEIAVFPLRIESRSVRIIPVGELFTK